MAVGASGAPWSRVALLGLVLAAVGDVALATKSKFGFLVGLGLFALAYSTYVVAFGLRGTQGAVLGVTAGVVALGAGIAWVTLHDLVPHRMQIPVGVYLVILASMLALGTAVGITHRTWLLTMGVALVAGSDIAVGRERFGTPGFVNKAFGLPTYYAGQILIALSLAG